MTADRGQVQVWAYAYICAWLAEDYWSCARIADELSQAAVPAGQVAETFSLAAAALLVDACGGDRGAARRVAWARLADDVTRQARMVTGQA